MTYNYIYCFPFNTTLKGGNYSSPPYPFRLPISEPFSVPVLNYVPIVRKYNISGPNEFPAVDSIHMGHFPMGSDAVDQRKWFDRIQELQHQNEAMKMERETSVSIVKHGWAWWTTISFVLILVMMSITLITYNVYISQHNTRSHHRIARDIMDLKSNYQEVKIDCPKCKPANVSTTKSSKKDSSVEVADRSVNINFNRPLPIPGLKKSLSEISL